MDEQRLDPLADPVAAGIVLPPILGLDDLQRVFRLRTRRAVHELRRREGLPLSRVGRQWVITRQLLQEWLDDRATGEHHSDVRAPRLVTDEEASS